MKEAVILAGGFGTRLQQSIGQEIPKPMAPVCGRPFLYYQLQRLEEAGYDHVVLSTGHLAEVIESHFGDSFGKLRLTYAREDKPLFTGGAIRFALQQTQADNVLVLNGDTLFDISLSDFEHFHLAHPSDVSVALRYVDNSSRYGAVEKNVDARIVAFHEKNNEVSLPGLINGGIYYIHRNWLLNQKLPEKFSFEKEVLQSMTQSIRCYGLEFRDYFIDIGVPEDYQRAQVDFLAIFPPCMDLFLDRDGILNTHRLDDYVKQWSEWEWIVGAREALAIAARIFRHICIISNQRGIGRGLFTMEALEDVHSHMLADIQESEGRIDHIYVCTDLEGYNRKPSPGMAMQASHDYPDIDFRQVLMVGDSVSDIQFGYRLGMQCIFITNGQPVPDEVHNYTNLFFYDLKEAMEYMAKGV